MDGVLVDTGDLHYRVWSAILADMGVPFSRDIFRPTFGMDNAGSLAAWIGHPLEPALVAQISDHKEELFRQAARGQVQALPGVREWLERLKAQGFRQAVASSAPQANIEVLVAELGLRPYFDALVSGQGMPGKPDPAVFLEAARRLDVPPDRCLVIEDSLAGVDAARAAGMKCLAVTTTNAPEALHGAYIVIERLDALPADAIRNMMS
jgi:HAD superfamily hydrolase (TIGR01509 family)